MGLSDSKEKKEQEKLTPDMEGYRPNKDWWPDLTDYRKAIILHNISVDDVNALLKEYAGINADPKKVKCEFSCTYLPDNGEWVYLEFPDAEGVPHYSNFWNYQNLTIWLSQKSDKEFCLAVPRRPSFPPLVSARDTQNPYGDSTIGVYADRYFIFTIPEEVLEWGPVPTAGFDYEGYLKGVFNFDVNMLSKMERCKWEKFEITLSFPEA